MPCENEGVKTPDVSTHATLTVPASTRTAARTKAADCPRPGARRVRLRREGCRCVVCEGCTISITPYLVITGRGVATLAESAHSCPRSKKSSF